jgi:hypothetical protein
MKKLLTLLVAGAVMATAQAAPVQTLTVNSNVLANVKNGSGVLDFDQFSAGLGTLLSVEVQLSSDLNGTFKIENKSRASGSDVTINAQNSVALSSAAFSLPTLANNYLNTVHEASYDNVDNYAGTSGQIITLAGQHASESMVFTDALTLAAFTGNGLVHATATGLGNTVFTSTAGNLHSSASSSFNAYGSVVYTYALPVPEPETYAMLLAGLGLMGAVLRKRKA